MLRKDLIVTGMNCQSSEEVIRQLAERFVAAGVARETFTEAVIARERVYPTALPASAFDIAIPHTMSEHVITPAIGVGVLLQPVEFCQMGSPDITLHPQLVFMLAIQDPKDQIGLLKKIMKLIQDEELLVTIRNAATAEDIYSLLETALN